MKQPFLTLLLLLLLSNQAIAENETAVIEDEPDNNTVLIVTSGCIGGAIIGTAIPIFGNIAGCVIGGFTSWWYND